MPTASPAPFSHWMLREIYEQPATLAATLAHYVQDGQFRPETCADIREWFAAAKGRDCHRGQRIEPSCRSRRRALDRRPQRHRGRCGVCQRVLLSFREVAEKCSGGRDLAVRRDRRYPCRTAEGARRWTSDAGRNQRGGFEHGAGGFGVVPHARRCGTRDPGDQELYGAAPGTSSDCIARGREPQRSRCSRSSRSIFSSWPGSRMCWIDR